MMADTDPIARTLLLFGLVLVTLGGLLLVAGRIPLLGRLPGDLRFDRGTTQVYIPLATSLVLSVVLTLVLTLVAFARR